MTTAELVKALRVCSRRTDCKGCGACPLFDNKDCMGDVTAGAADLIEWLIGANKDLHEELEWKAMVIALAQKEQAKAEAERDALRERVPQWISVEDRHPKPGTRVLATDGVFVGEAYRTSADTWRRYDGIAMRDCIGSVVTHWMPLPEAPKFADILRGAPEAPEDTQ